MLNTALTIFFAFLLGCGIVLVMEVSSRLWALVPDGCSRVIFAFVLSWLIAATILGIILELVRRDSSR